MHVLRQKMTIGQKRSINTISNIKISENIQNLYRTENKNQLNQDTNPQIEAKLRDNKSQTMNSRSLKTSNKLMNSLAVVFREINTNPLN